MDAPSYRGGRVVHREQRSWSHLTMIVDDIHCDDILEVDFDSGSTSLSVALDEVGGRMRTSEINDTRRQHPGKIGSINVLPAGFRAEARGAPIRFLRQLFIQIDDERLASVFGEYGDIKRQLNPQLMLVEPRLSKICQLLAEECRSPELGGGLYADSLTTALLVTLSRLSGATVAAPSRGGLAPWQLRRTQDFMKENIAGTISLSELAGLIDFSPTHFCRAFKASTGQAPHRWLLGVRIEQAKEYLIEKTMPIAGISSLLGFYDQSHFTRTFTGQEGVSPMAWQRSRAA
jgi:AraC family transcriptional regulator